MNRLATTTAALIVALGFAACSSAPQSTPEEATEASQSEPDGEHVTAESSVAARPEAEGEHAESSEAREGGEHAEGRESREGGEHAGEEGEGHDEGEEGEEGGVYIGSGDTWDTTRRGARLVLTFDAETDAFRGTVENTTESTICSVRVEVHLSTGTELGPTPRTDLAAGESTEVALLTGGEAFDTWTAHPEVSACSSE